MRAYCSCGSIYLNALYTAWLLLQSDCHFIYGSGFLECGYPVSMTAFGQTDSVLLSCLYNYLVASCVN